MLESASAAVGLEPWFPKERSGGVSTAVRGAASVSQDMSTVAGGAESWWLRANLASTASTLSAMGIGVRGRGELGDGENTTILE